MSLWDKLRGAFEDGEMRETDDGEFDPDDEPQVQYAEPHGLAEILNRVINYRNDEIRELRSKSYEINREIENLKRANGLLEYERNEALQRVAKLVAVMNKKQIAALTKAPFEYRFGPPPLEILGYDEKGQYRRIPVPTPATMETVKRKGSHGGSPLVGVTVYSADKKTEQSNRDIEREQATLRKGKK